MADEFDTPEPTVEGALLARIERYLSGAASEIEVAQLNHDLAASSENRDSFTRLANLSGLMAEHFSLSRAHAEVETSLRELSETATRSQPISAQKSKSPVLRFLGRVPVVFTRPVIWSIVAVALLFYSGFIILSWNLRPDKLAGVVKNENAAVAVVRETTNVQWSKTTDSKPAASSILLGEPLKINSGTIELELNAGTKLVVEGPADWSVDGNNRVSLQSGKLTAHVPKQAIGFIIQTPTARIVDLGTEFGVETDKQGATEVQVRKGTVEIYADNLTGDSSRTSLAIKLSAGMARRIEVSPGRAAVIQVIEAKPNRFTTQLSGTKPKQIPVFGAMASSEYSGRGAHSLVNGSGMHGDGHDNATDAGMMWLSDGVRVNGEYVLFDLGKPSRIESLKVWNYNEQPHNAYASRGVKQADIYVSDTGKNDPLSNPQDWRLVIADQKFSAADGTSNYSTPDTISLGGAEARFVAIVIDERLGDDPTQPTRHFVGLSEVQFFGERVPAKNLKIKK